MPTRETRRAAYGCGDAMDASTGFPSGSLVAFSVYDLNEGPDGDVHKRITISGYEYFKTPLRPVSERSIESSVEVNEAALGAARRNALLNGCERCAAFGYAWELPSLSGDRGLVDVAVANMMPGPLLSVIPELIARTREDGLLLISGFRAEDVPALRRVLEPHFAVPAEPALTRVGRADEAGGEWLAFVCRRRVGTGFDLAELSASAV